MRYTRVDREKAMGTSFQGTVKATYTELCQIFGQPDGPTSDGKIQAHWTIKIADAIVATIYDWKEDQPAREVILWHVGGKVNDVHQLIDIIMREQRKAITSA